MLNSFESQDTQKEVPSLNIFLLWQNTTTSYKTRKTNPDFSLNFYGGEAHIVRSVQQI